MAAVGRALHAGTLLRRRWRCWCRAVRVERERSWRVVVRLVHLPIHASCCLHLLRARVVFGALGGYWLIVDSVLVFVQRRRE